jgi:hypothetical protein
MKTVKTGLIILLVLFPSLSTAATYHFVHHGLATGKNDGSSWANAWRDVDNIDWATLTSEAASQPVYVCFKKGVEISNDDLRIIGSGSSETNRIILTVDPDDSGTTPVFDGEWTTSYPIDVRGNYITIENFHVTRAGSCNIFQYNTDADYVIIQDCIIDYANKHGIYSGNTNNHPIQGPKGDNWVVRRCFFDSNGIQNRSMTHGIYVRYGDNWTVEYCKFTNHEYGFAVVWATDCDNWIVRYNYSENNGKIGSTNGDKGGGFSPNGTDGVSDNYEICYNVSNGDRVGIFINSNDAYGTKIIGNTVYNSAVMCFFVQPNVTVDQVYNNIFWMAGDEVFYVSDGVNLTNSDCNNIGPEGNRFIYYCGNGYTTLDACKSGTGKEPNSISANPGFANVLNDDFSLGSDSPCVDAGANDPGKSYGDGLPSTWRWDVGSEGRKQGPTLLDQDSFGSRWEIGAFTYSGEPDNTPPDPPLGVTISSQ